MSARGVCLSLALLFFPWLLQGGEDASAVSAQAPGAPVEVTLRTGEAVVCHLRDLKDGVLTLRLNSGEVRRESSGDVRTLRFLDEAPAAPAGSSNAAQPPDFANDLSRLRQLAQEERDAGALGKSEAAELAALRERVPPRMRWIIADEMARSEAHRGRLDGYILLLRQRLKAALFDDGARETLIALLYAYRQKEYTPEEILAKAREDIGAIAAPRLRQRMGEKLPEMLASLHNKGEKEHRKQ